MTHVFLDPGRQSSFTVTVTVTATATVVVVGQCQKIHDHATGLLVGGLLQHPVEAIAEGLPWEQLVTISQARQSHGVLTQRVDHVMVTDDMLMRPLACCPSTRQCEHEARPGKESILSSQTRPVK